MRGGAHPAFTFLYLAGFYIHIKYSNGRNAGDGEAACGVGNGDTRRWRERREQMRCMRGCVRGWGGDVPFERAACADAAMTSRTSALRARMGREDGVENVAVEGEENSVVARWRWSRGERGLLCLDPHRRAVGWRGGWLCPEPTWNAPGVAKMPEPPLNAP